MKFFFPDAQDVIYPGYDFLTDEYPPHRVRQRDDRYAHEVLDPLPYDGMLISKAIIDGVGSSVGKYSRPSATVSTAVVHGPSSASPRL